jgi:hypothetical protein
VSTKTSIGELISKIKQANNAAFCSDTIIRFPAYGGFANGE